MKLGVYDIEKLTFGRIYSIRDTKKNVFVYVGRTINPNDLSPHGVKMCQAMSNSNNKNRYLYCIEREWESISLKELLIQETRFIIRRNTFHSTQCPWGMNFVMTCMGTGRMNDASRKKLSEIRKKALSTKEARNRLSQSLTGLKRSEAVKSRIGRLMNINWSKPDFRKKFSDGARRRCSDPRAVKERSEISKRLGSDPEFLKKKSDSAIKHFSNPENRKRLSEQAVKQWASPGFKEKRRSMMEARRKEK